MLPDHKRKLQEIIGNEQAAAMIPIYVKDAYSTQLRTGSHQLKSSGKLGKLSQEEMEILAYIGGCLARKARAWATRTKRHHVLDLVNLLQDDSANTYSKWIDIKRRKSDAQLVIPTVVFAENLQEMELLFRQCNNRADFMSYNIQITQDVSLNHFFKLLFFKVRIHHHCKKLMDTYRIKKGVSAKQRPLRDEL